MIRQVSPAVVSIEATKPPAVGKTKPTEESGSGVLIKIDGMRGIIVVTNNHVVSNAKADHITVHLADNRVFRPTMVWADPESDMLEERRARAVQLRRTLRSDVTGGAGILDPSAIAQVTAECWPEARDADELHDALLSLIVLPPVEEWQAYFAELSIAGRVRVIEREGQPFWVATERMHLTGDVLATVRGWMESLGPVTAQALASRLGFTVDAIEAALLKMESEGQVMRGRFHSDAPPDQTEWCNRRVLARIHRLTLGQLRREIEPVTATQFERFLHRWQHVLPGSRLHGVDGTLQIIKQLQGYEISAAAWEPEVLANRVARYEPDFLDQLCLAGEVMWARLSPHPAFDIPEPRRVRPTRTAPIAIFLRESADWLEAPLKPPVLSHPAGEVLQQLEQRGASFFADLMRSTGRLASEVEDGLWELVAAGLVTADGFENLRALIDPKRRRGEGRGRHARPRHAAGRWALIRPAAHTVTSARSSQLLRRAIAIALGRRFPRSPDARIAGSAVAGSVAGAAPPRSARDHSRRTFCLGIQRRTIRAPGGARSAAGAAPFRASHRTRASYPQLRSAESHRDHPAGPARQHAATLGRLKPHISVSGSTSITSAVGLHFCSRVNRCNRP